MNTQNANFHYFKPSGKYYTDARGKIPRSDSVWSREELLACNDGLMPGLVTKGEGFIVVIIPDGPSGWPQLKLPLDKLPELR